MLEMEALVGEGPWVGQGVEQVAGVGGRLLVQLFREIWRCGGVMEGAEGLWQMMVWKEGWSSFGRDWVAGYQGRHG